MKPRMLRAMSVWIVAAVAATAGAQTAKGAGIVPPFVPNELVVSYYVDFMPIANPALPGRTVHDMFSAAGVSVVSDRELTPPEVVEHLAVVRLNAGTKWGRAFRAMQTFQAGVGSRWYLLGIQPNFLSFASPPPGARRLYNLSTRAEVRTGESATIGGLIVPGDYPRLVVIKVRGPSLAAFGIGRPLANPKVTLHDASGPILANDDWGGLREWEKTLARTLVPAPDHTQEAMLVTYLDPGAYTAVVESVDGTPGVALLELYLLDDFIVN